MKPHAPPRDITEIENIWIDLADGTKIAARMWLPSDASQNPVPAVLEYIPYRKRDSTAPRDEAMHPYVASNGYACLRVDIRGNGDSEGLMLDEYLQQELDDGVEIIEWIARQPWCSGQVGMMGISWGGFNGLQIAAMRPPALKAIITVCSTDDRYSDDIHFRGGALLNDNLSWSAAMMAYSSRPPDPQVVGEGWRDMWMDRLKNMPFLAANWLEHQRRDSFWEHGSVSEDLDAIEIPVLAVGGWADPYSNAIPRLVAGLSGPVAGLIGPWGHKYPHIGVPGPAMDFLSEMVRWWDCWLSDRQDGQDIPALRSYMLDGEDSGKGDDCRAGFWVEEPSWPSPNIEPTTLFMTDQNGLDRTAGSAAALTVCSPLTTGLEGGRFYPKLGRIDLASDQRADDAGSLLFDGPVLDAPLDLLGAPTVELELSVDRPQANIAVRLCHVAPDGASHRISHCILNLTHRDSHAQPQPVQPGQRYNLRLQLDDIGYRVPLGHHLRVAVSTAYWPIIWPSAEPVMLTLYTAGCLLEVPVRRATPQADGTHLTPIKPVALAGTATLRTGQNKRSVSHDLMTGETIFELVDDGGLKQILAHGLESGSCGRESYGIKADDPSSAWAKCEWSTEIGRADWRIRTESRSMMNADIKNFYLEAELIAFENDEEVYRHQWKRTIARDLV